jgi:uncharacterized membrane-anchored protein
MRSAVQDHPVFPARLLAAALLLAAPARAEAPALQWTHGPATVALGSQADLELPEGYQFVDAKTTQKLMESMGNHVSKREVGLVAPSREGADWIMVFEYDAVGYVKDDEKDKIDKNALLESIREGTEEGNKRRKEMGVPALHVTGWFEEPHYDGKSHNLVWALAAQDDDKREVVNYNMRVLGRQGVMSVTLVDAPEGLKASKEEAESLMEAFSYKSGKTYAEFRPGDKVAEYGLVALVAGGAGAAAVKLGLFAWLAKAIAKGGKAIVALVVLVLAGLKNLIARLFGRRAEAR